MGLATAQALLGWLMVVNAVGAGLFYADKKAAFAGRRRIPERTLLTFALAGGAPAMLILGAQIRHKTSKQPFRTLLIAALAINAIVLLAVLLLRP